MGIWSRRSQNSPSEPDETFTFFSVDRAARFRQAAREGFALAGLEVTVYADFVVDSSGRQFGLTNVAAACHNDPRGERAWSEVTRQHADRIVRAMDASPFDGLSLAQVHAATYPRLMAADSVQPWMTYGNEVAPGLVEVLNLDLPETVAFFGDERVTQFGPLEDLRRAGWANLRAVVADHHQVLERDGGRIDVLHGESMFMASTMLMIGEVAARWGPAPDSELGVFVAVPFRHQLAFHVVRDSSAIASLPMLAGFAAAGYDDAVGALSPDVYWWRPSGPIRISSRTPAGINLDVDTELSAVFERLVAGS